MKQDRSCSARLQDWLNSYVARTLKSFLCQASLSHMLADEPFVRELAKGLEDVGNAVIFSGNSLLAGQRWQDQLPTSLREADAVLIVGLAIIIRELMAEMVAALGYFQERGRPLGVSTYSYGTRCLGRVGLQPRRYVVYV